MLVGGVVTGFQGGFHLFKGLIHAGGFDFLLGGHAGAFDADIDEALDALHEVDLATGDETDGFSLPPGTTRAANAVDVVLGVVGEFQIDDEVDVVHVEAARGHVGGHEDFDVAAAEVPHHALPHRLIDVSMQAVGGVTSGHEGVGGVIDGTFRVGEDDGEARGFDVDHSAEHFELRAALHFVVALLDGRYGQRLLLNRDGGGVVRVVFNQPADARLKGGAEENRLAFFWHGGHQAVDVLGEAHVEHFVGFVKDERLESVELDQAALNEIENASRCADDDLGAALQRTNLPVV